MGLLFRTLAIVAIFLLLLFLAPMLIGEKGYVLVALGNYTIEFTVVSLVFMLIAAVVLLYVALRLIKSSSSTLVNAGRWFSLGRSNKQEIAFYDGLFALALGDKTQAQAKMELAKSNRFYGFNYLALGQLALQQGDSQTAETWFKKAKSDGNAQCKKTTVLLQAQQALQSGNPQLALDTIDELENPKDPQVVRVRAQAMAATEQWKELAEALPNWKKALGEQYNHYNERTAMLQFAEIASKQGANQLKEHWQNLPRKQRNDETYRLAFLQQLIHQGMHQDTQTYLVDWYHKKPLSPQVLTMIKSLRLSQPTHLIKLLESGIKNHPDVPEYYAALGHIAFHAGDNQLCEKVLVKALALDETEQELLLLAELYERNHAFEQALQAMRKVNEQHR